MTPALADPLHDGLKGVVHPAIALAALGLGQRVADAPATVWQVTCPADTTHTDVALSQLRVMPELPQGKLPWHGPLLSLLSHAPPLLEDVPGSELHAATTTERGTARTISARSTFGIVDSVLARPHIQARRPS